MSLGTWGLSGGGYGPVADDEVDRTLDRAMELGINLFETSDAYGRGAMEQRLGARLSKEMLVATKIGTDLDSVPPRKRFDLTHLREAFDRCRDRLGRERIDLVLLHNPTNLGMAQSEAFDFFRELKRLGALRAWGVSAGSVEIAKFALRKGADVIEIAYNVFLGSDLHLLANDVALKGVGVLARSVLAHGLLTGDWTTERVFAEGDHRRDRWTKEELALRLGQLDALRPIVGGVVPSLRAAALRFVLAAPLISSAVLGPRSAQQLEQLVSDAGTSPPYLRDTTLAELGARLKAAGVLI